MVGFHCLRAERDRCARVGFIEHATRIIIQPRQLSALPLVLDDEVLREVVIVQRLDGQLLDELPHRVEQKARADPVLPITGRMPPGFLQDRKHGLFHARGGHLAGRRPLARFGLALGLGRILLALLLLL